MKKKPTIKELEKILDEKGNRSIKLLETPQCYQPDLLARYGKDTKDIKSITQNQYTGTIQIALEGGRIWIDTKLIVLSDKIATNTKISFIDDTKSGFGIPGSALT